MSWRFDKEKEHWPEMRPHLCRLLKAICLPVGRHHKGRLGIVDLPHALVNLPVEFCRLMPYQAGHIWFFSSLILLILAVI